MRHEPTSRPPTRWPTSGATTARCCARRATSRPRPAARATRCRRTCSALVAAVHPEMRERFYGCGAAAAAGARRLHRARPRLRHGARLFVLSRLVGEQRPRDRRRHDARAARGGATGTATGTREQLRLRALQRRLRRGLHRGPARARHRRRQRRRGGLELRRQPLARQAARLPRDLPRAQAGRRALLLGRLRRPARARRAADATRCCSASASAARSTTRTSAASSPRSGCADARVVVERADRRSTDPAIERRIGMVRFRVA